MNNKNNLKIKLQEVMKTAKIDEEFGQKFHLYPPIGLLNDPNGFIQFKGIYHLFYQWNPFACEHGSKFWGHYSSKDLVNWTHEEVALIPDTYYEKNGCYSGSAVEDNGIMKLIYTGNVKHDNGTRDTYQCLAESTDGFHIKKSGIIMKNQPKGYTKHFRDPKIWKKDDTWYMIIGTQTIEEKGCALLFESSDLNTWKFKSEVAGSELNGLGEFGYMWECPDLFELNNKDILIASPQGLEAKGDLYNNIYQSGYFIGKLDYKTGKLNHGEFIELDRGFDFYAPQTTLDEKGRRLLVAWMGIPEEEEHPTVKNGWIHCMTMPRELKLIDNKLYQLPVEEIKTLRKNEINYNNLSIENETISIENIKGEIIELELEFDVIKSEKFGINFRVSEKNNQKTILLWDNLEKKLILDRSLAGKGYKGVRKVKLDNLTSLRLFIDQSSVEIFVNNGEEVFSARIYPDKDSKYINFYSLNGKTSIKSIKKWDLI
jgi:beta-fructofuranosidase